jgi:hypothetical protein
MAEADILVCNSKGKPVLVAEVRNRQELSAGVATALRRNLAAHNLLPSADYFLLASQDFGYLWNASDAAKPDAPPTAQFPMSDVIKRYHPKVRPEERLGGTELEMVLLHWLNDLAGPNGNPPAEPEAMLARTGLLEELRGSTIHAHAKS